MRPLVKKFLPYWQARLKSYGAALVRQELQTPGKTKLLGRKDRMELLRELGLR